MASTITALEETKKHLINVAAPQQLQNLTEAVDSPSKHWFYFPTQLQNALDALKESQITKSVDMVEVILEVVIDYLVPSNIVEDGAVFIGKCLQNPNWRYGCILIVEKCNMMKNTKSNHSDQKNENTKQQSTEKQQIQNQNNDINDNEDKKTKDDDKKSDMNDNCKVDKIVEFEGSYIWTDLGPQVSKGHGSFNKDGTVKYCEETYNNDLTQRHSLTLPCYYDLQINFGWKLGDNDLLHGKWWSDYGGTRYDGDIEWLTRIYQFNNKDCKWFCDNIKSFQGCFKDEWKPPIELLQLDDDKKTKNTKEKTND